MDSISNFFNGFSTSDTVDTDITKLRRRSSESVLNLPVKSSKSYRLSKKNFSKSNSELERSFEEPAQLHRTLSNNHVKLENTNSKKIDKKFFYELNEFVNEFNLISSDFCLAKINELVINFLEISSHVFDFKSIMREFRETDIVLNSFLVINNLKKVRDYLNKITNVATFRILGLKQFLEILAKEKKPLCLFINKLCKNPHALDEQINKIIIKILGGKDFVGFLINIIKNNNFEKKVQMMIQDQIKFVQEQNLEIKKLIKTEPIYWIESSQARNPIDKISAFEVMRAIMPETQVILKEIKINGSLIEFSNEDSLDKQQVRLKTLSTLIKIFYENGWTLPLEDMDEVEISKQREIQAYLDSESILKLESSQEEDKDFKEPSALKLLRAITVGSLFEADALFRQQNAFLFAKPYFTQSLISQANNEEGGISIEVNIKDSKNFSVTKKWISYCKYCNSEQYGRGFKHHIVTLERSWELKHNENIWRGEHNLVKIRHALEPHKNLKKGD